MRRIYSALSLLFLSLFFLQCQREVSYVGGPDNPVGEIVLPDPITAALQGNVFDENGAPAAGVTVQAGSKTAVTDAQGYFRINNASLDKKSAVVTATKAGYFKAYRTFGATSGANNVFIKLIKRTLAGNIDGATGGEVSLSNGSKIALSANGVVNAATGAAYTGQVKVYAAYIDPAAADFDQIVPGSLMADNKDGRRVLLTSYGMLSVELESASGEKLQVKSGSTAKLTTAIPATAQASAPATIPLWYVDEATGIWKEEGSATKNGNVYVGDVKHFTYWNCDLQVPTITFKAKLVTAGGQPLVNTVVNVRPASGNYWGYAHGYTDSLGQVTGPVPSNMNLILEVMQFNPNGCYTPIYTQNIGPFTQSTDLGTITVTSTSNNAIITIKGKLVNCSNAPVTNGYAVIHVGYSTLYAGVNATGDFEKTFVQCGASVSSYSVFGIDSSTQQQSSLVTGTITAAVTDLGNISACGTSTSQFINYTLDGISYNLVSPADSLTGGTSSQGSTTNYTFINGMRSNATTSISFNFQSPSQTPGTYQATYFAVNNLPIDTSRTTTPVNVSVTNFPASAGSFYEGSLSGQFTDMQNVNHTISGTFRVRRRN